MLFIWEQNDKSQKKNFFLKSDKFLVCGECEEGKCHMQKGNRNLTSNWFEITSSLVWNGMKIDVNLAWIRLEIDSKLTRDWLGIDLEGNLSLTWR